MSRRIVLIALWLLFAGAAVGVGFGAAGLVGSPFTDVGPDFTAVDATHPLASSDVQPTGDSSRVSSPTGSVYPSTHPTSAADPSVRPPSTPAATAGASSPRPSPTSRPPSSPTPRSTRTSGSGGDDDGSPRPRSSSSSQPEQTRSGTSTAPAPAPVVRGISTRAGYVSGSCTNRAVEVSASPAVGWVIDSVDGGRREEATVRFSEPGSGSSLSVTATCEDNGPRFEISEEEEQGSDG